MRGLGNGEMRQALWEKHYWTGADDKLTFEQVEILCRRLNIHSNHEDLFSLFKVFYLSFLASRYGSYFLFIVFFSKPTSRNVVFLILMISVTLSSC